MSDSDEWLSVNVTAFRNTEQQLKCRRASALNISLSLFRCACISTTNSTEGIVWPRWMLGVSMHSPLLTSLHWPLLRSILQVSQWCNGSDTFPQMSRRVFSKGLFSLSILSFSQLGHSVEGKHHSKVSSHDWAEQKCRPAQAVPRNHCWNCKSLSPWAGPEMFILALS